MFPRGQRDCGLETAESGGTPEPFRPYIGLRGPPSGALGGGLFGGLPGLLAKDEAEEAGEALFKFLFADGDETAGALGAGEDEPGFAEDGEMVGDGGLRDIEGDVPTGKFTGIHERPQDLDPAGIGEGLHDRRQGDIAEGRVGVGLHRQGR